jgi:hypothetical protein
VKSDTTDGAVDNILKVLQDEAQRLDICPSVENPQKKNRSNVIAVSLKRHGQTFRITLNWVRQEYVSQSGPMLGTGYIEKQFHLRLRPEKPGEIPIEPPFHWEVYPYEAQHSQGAPLGILDEPWLRRLIQKTLALSQNS